MKFVIYAPGDYTPNGGGCVVLHRLAHNIALCGEESYIMTSKKNPKYLGEQVTQEQAIELCKNGAMAIYPEVTTGNPFKAKKVMRWILYHVRNYGMFGIYQKTDLVYKYAPFFNLRFNQDVQGELRAVELNLDIFVNRNEERSGACFLIKKENHKEHIHPANSIQLDDYPNKGGNEYLADVFNKCENFYAYDTATWLSIMAALCGCKSIVVPNTGVTPEQWHNGYPYFKYGIAYGLDDLGYAEETLHLLKPKLLEIEAETLEETKAFIQKAKTL